MNDLLSKLITHYVLLSTLQPFDEYCYSTDKDRLQRKHYSLETSHPYDNVYTRPVIKGCTPRKIWLVSRHGTRYPSMADMDKLSYLPFIQSKIGAQHKLCQSDYELIKNWNLSSNPKTPCALTNPQGREDLKYLAISFKTMFPELFDPIYSPKTYSFGHSSAERCRASCESFSEGIFGTGMMQWYSSIHWMTDNLMLRPWENCILYKKNSDRLMETINQMDLFMTQQPFVEMMYNISQRLGTSEPLTYPQLSLIWNECRYQQAYHLTKPSAWCSTFSLDEAKVLEYIGDLDLYYKLSYGNAKLNTKLSCASVQDILHFMEDEKSPNKVTAYFSHAELLLLMLTAFGTHNDTEPLLATNYYQQQNRKFRTSQMVPYAGSLAAVKYECPDATTDGEKRKILFLQNQLPLKMSWCKDESVCTLAEFRQFFNRSSMRDCPHKICGPEFEKLSDKSNTRCPDCC